MKLMMNSSNDDEGKKVDSEDAKEDAKIECDKPLPKLDDERLKQLEKNLPRNWRDH